MLMKVLVACEESQRVCTAFRERGHEAYSCDIQECSGGHPEWHIMQDALPLINGNCEFCTLDGTSRRIDGRWDLLIAHPPCTYLTNAGNKYFCIEKYGKKAVERISEREKALQFFLCFVNADCDRIAIENPVGHVNTWYRRADQIIHPYYFAESITDAGNYQVKQTCLWLKGLPLLRKVTDLPKPRPHHTKPCGRNVYYTEHIGGKDARKIRSKTFPGIAKAMAEQWG